MRMPAASDHNGALLVGGEWLHYELRRSPRRRTLSIEVHPDLRVIVRAPARADARFVADRVTARAPWIRRTLDRFRRAGHCPAPSGQLQQGDTHYYLGVPYRLRVVVGRSAGVLVDGDALEVTVKQDPTPARVHRALAKWHRERGLELAQAVVACHFSWFEDRGHAPPAIRFREMRTRWGSLSGGRRMTLNLSLMRAPPACLEYVVVHELCHLEHAGHGGRFDLLMDRLLPDWRARQQLLQTQHPAFSAIGSGFQR